MARSLPAVRLALALAAALAAAAAGAQVQRYEHCRRGPLPERDAPARPVPERVRRAAERLWGTSSGDRHPSAEAPLVELHALLRDFSSLGVERG